MVRKHPFIGKVLAKDYKILSFLGKGGMGSVFVAKQLSLNREVAIKILPSIELDPEELHRFECEIATMATLCHPNIVTIHHRGKYGDPPTLYYVMELLEGGSLKEYLNKCKKIAPAHAIRLITPIAEALAFAHEQGCIHRDIKPANLLFSRNYRSLKIADFGIAKLKSGAHITQSQAMIGTFLYAAPEQMKWYENEEDTIEEIDERADQYSLGIVLYEMIAGRPPYKAKNLVEMMKALSHPPPSLSSVAQFEIPSSLEWLVSTMISKSREKRFPDDESLLDAFTTLELELVSSASTRVFAVHTQSQEILSVTPPSPITGFPSQSEKILLQSMETIECGPFNSPWEKYRKTWLPILKMWGLQLFYTRRVLMFLSFILLISISLLYYYNAKENSSEIERIIEKTHSNHPDSLEPLSPAPFLVQLRIVPSYHPLPPPNYPKLQVILMTSRGIRPVKLEDRIPPGYYQLSVVLPGYKCQQHGQVIEIRPIQLYHLAITLNALPRKVNPKILNISTGEYLLPKTFTIDGKEVIGNYFEPGKHYLYALFEQYQEIHTQIWIPPGEDTFQYQTSLIPLDEISFTIEAPPIQEIGQVKFPLELEVDGRLYPALLFRYKKLDKKIYVKLKISPLSHQILLRMGFYYEKTQLKQVTVVKKFTQIDLDLLIFYLKQIKKRDILLKILKQLRNYDQKKILHTAKRLQKRFYNFLCSQCKSSIYTKIEAPIWELRRLLNPKEAREHKEFLNCLHKTQSVSFSQRVILWEMFYRKYPKGIYRKKVRGFLRYNRELIKYENFLRKKIHKCYLRTKEKKIIKTWQKKIKRKDIEVIHRKIDIYLKEIGCSRSIRDLLQ